MLVCHLEKKRGDLKKYFIVKAAGQYKMTINGNLTIFIDIFK
jgi:hypothetical protein